MSNNTTACPLTARLIALAEEQTAATRVTDSVMDQPQCDDKPGDSDFPSLLAAVDVNHRLPLLEARSLARYQAILRSRWALLSDWLTAASELPLLPAATSLQDNAPPTATRVLGSTLHHQFDSACTAIGCLLEGSPMNIEAHEKEKAAMDAYVRVCADRTRIAIDRLPTQLAGAVVSGLLADMSALLNQPGESRTQRGVTRKHLRKHLSDIQDILDSLSLQSTERVLHYAEDYRANGSEHRARRLLEAAVRNDDNCIETRLALARLYASLGRSEQAIQHLRALVTKYPDDMSLRRELASILLQRLEFAETIDQLQHALTLATADQCPPLRQALELAESLHASERQAALEDTVPTISLTDDERLSGCCNPAKLALAAKLFQTYGTLVIHNVFSTELIDQCRNEFLHRYRHYFTDRKHSTALKIGDRRFQISLALAGAFNTPEFYANPFILPLMKRLLGKQLIIGSTVCATSLPGSRDQHGHKDHRALFTNVPDDDPIDLPPVAVTTMIPLVSVNEDNGTTLVKKGSHRLSRRASNKLDYQMPIVPAGSCYLMDLALTHKGQGNQTDQVRPIVNMVYHRSWFVDNKNFRNQPPLQIDSVEYRRIPKEHRYLFDWAIQPGAQVDTPR